MTVQERMVRSDVCNSLVTASISINISIIISISICSSAHLLIWSSGQEMDAATFCLLKYTKPLRKQLFCTVASVMDQLHIAVLQFFVNRNPNINARDHLVGQLTNESTCTFLCTCVLYLKCGMIVIAFFFFFCLTFTIWNPNLTFF